MGTSFGESGCCARCIYTRLRAAVPAAKFGRKATNGSFNHPTVLVPTVFLVISAACCCTRPDTGRSLTHSHMHKLCFESLRAQNPLSLSLSRSSLPPSSQFSTATNDASLAMLRLNLRKRHGYSAYLADSRPRHSVSKPKRPVVACGPQSQRVQSHNSPMRHVQDGSASVKTESTLFPQVNSLSRPVINRNAS